MRNSSPPNRSPHRTTCSFTLTMMQKYTRPSTRSPSPAKSSNKCDVILSRVDNASPARTEGYSQGFVVSERSLAVCTARDDKTKRCARAERTSVNTRPQKAKKKIGNFRQVVILSRAHKIIGATSMDFGARHRVAQYCHSVAGTVRFRLHRAFASASGICLRR